MNMCSHTRKSRNVPPWNGKWKRERKVEEGATCAWNKLRVVMYQTYAEACEFVCM